MPRVQGCYKHTAFLPYILRQVSRTRPIARQSSIFLYGIIGSGQKTEDRGYVCSTTNIRQFFHFVQLFSVPE